ncbi:MAG TPA: ABC transporter permease [Methanoregulaceae archaeon]|nr:ABC transporter permease [Methanoregulaceae archaeon]
MNAGHIWLVMKKDLKGLGHERTIMLAILLQLFIALFSSFLMVGLTSMYDPSALSQYSRYQYPVGYCGSDSDIKKLLQENRGLRIYDMDLSTALQALKERKLSAVVYVPDTKPDAPDPVKITLYTIQNDLQAAVVDVKLKDVFTSYESELRQIRIARLNELPVPLGIPATSGASSFYEFVYGLLIPLLVLMPAIISSALVIDLITEEYQNNTLETLLSTPIGLHEILWGKIAAALVLVPVQAGAWLLLLAMNGIYISGVLQILLHVTAVAAILILFGTIIALYYRERTAAQFVYSTAIVAVLLFALAFPANPLNIIAKLGVGAAGVEQWLVLGIVTAAVILLSLVTDRFAVRVMRLSQSPK